MCIRNADKAGLREVFHIDFAKYDTVRKVSRDRAKVLEEPPTGNEHFQNIGKFMSLATGTTVSDLTFLSRRDCGSPVVKVSDHGRPVMNSSPVPLKTHRVEERGTLNLLRAQTSSVWCGVVVRKGKCQLRYRPHHLTMVQNDEVRRQKSSCS
ncbi:uncharacterized protein TNCV_2269601 [Trichonephila clavipes]|nr:uncharacterized protein TNCV_2269601 [Trichonephila clavipes]